MELNELLEQIDIVEYIGQFVDLEQRGEEWWGLSCFKEENTPSFSVRPDPPVFFDYSSGRGGNAYTFTKEYFHCSSKEAVEILKKYAGVDGEIATIHNARLSATKVCKKYSKPKSKSKQSKGTILPDDYMDRYERRDDKLEVWKQEGISDEVLDKFQVRYDGFSNRLVYPIRNLDGKIVNVGNRTLDPQWKEKGLRKYSYNFAWGSIQTMYGLHENMVTILEKHEVIIFEGCKSVLIAQTWGINNTAAMLTSHLSSNQLKILARLGVNVVFALDKDVRIKDDKNIAKLKSYVNVEYIWDWEDLLDEKDSPVDKGKEVFEILYERRLRL